MDAEVGLCIAPGESLSVREYRDRENEGWAPGNWGRTSSLRVHPFSAFSARPLTHEALEEKTLMATSNINPEADEGLTERQLEMGLLAGTEEEVFKRRNSIPRSPTVSRRGSNSSVGSVSSIDVTGRKKRPRTEDNNPDLEEFHEFKNMMAKIKENSSELEKLIKIIPNTKSDIKRLITDMAYTINRLNKKCIEWEALPKQTKEISAKKPTMKEIGTQANIMEDKEDEAHMESIKADRLRKTIEDASNFESVCPILFETWPEETYRKTVREEGNPAKTDLKEWDIVLIVNVKQDERGIVKHMIDRYPEIRETARDMSTKGPVEYIISETNIKTRKKKEGSKRTFYLCPYEAETNELKHAEETYDQILDLKKCVEENNSKNIAYVVPTTIDTDKIRKIAEYVFWNTDINIKFMYPKKLTDPKEKTAKDLRKTILVKTREGIQYADLLKSVKNCVDINKLGVKVNNVKKTKSGDLLLSVETEKIMAETLTEEIKNKMEGYEVKLNKKTTILHLMDIEGDVNEGEIIDAISTEVQVNQEEELKVTSLRPGRDGNQTATLVTSKRIAAELLRRTKLRIGWTNCTIRERINVLRCYKCLEFGHTRTQCNNNDKSDNCLNCGEGGHKAKECKKDPHCESCKDKHRADSTRCPVFRKLLLAEKGKRR